MDHIDLFSASTPKGKAQPFPLFELDEDGEIKLDLENDNEFNLDNLSFKAVNKGLGFHHKDALKNSAPLLKRQKTSLKEASNTPAVIIGQPAAQNKTFDPVTLSQAELALLGGTQKEIKKTLSENTQLKFEKKTNDASLVNQASAWVIDLACIAFCLAATLASFTLLSGIQVNTLVNLLSPLETGIFLGSLFVIYYLLYFTVLDLQQTPGKSILGVRLERLDGRRIKVKQTFTRAVVSLLSFVLMGLPLTMDFQGKLSDTKVVR